VGWCLENNVDDLWQYLGMFLQGIQLNSYKSDVEVVNSNRRCESLAEKTKDMKNGAELKDWIIRTAIQPTDEFEAYIATKSLLIDPRESSSKEGLLLWTLMYGRRPSKRVRDAVKVALNASFSKQHALKIDLYAQESDKGWFIVPSLPKFFFKGSRSQEEAAFQLLPLESLRQQLDEREGICCAYYRPDECICPLPWRKALSRILQWARENKFGTGKWRDLPPKCTSRN
jgi:hypothetical protein